LSALTYGVEQLDHRIPSDFSRKLNRYCYYINICVRWNTVQEKRDENIFWGFLTSKARKFIASGFMACNGASRRNMVYNDVGRHLGTKFDIYTVFIWPGVGRPFHVLCESIFRQ
jgi:hypothetical protein